MWKKKHSKEIKYVAKSFFIVMWHGRGGTIELQNIKRKGGITFDQDTDSAAYDAMSQSARNAEVVDFILSSEKMPQQLLELNNTFNILPFNDHDTPDQLTEEENFKKYLPFFAFVKALILLIINKPLFAGALFAEW